LGLQIAILKVLASYPDGRATVAAMNSDLAILSGAGAAWSQRLKMLAARAPGLDIFSEGFVIRDSDGWQLTPAGRKALHRIEHPLPPKAIIPKLELVQSTVPARLDPAKPVLYIVGRNDHRRRRRFAAERSA
jgi:hypothetical protein